MRPADVVDAVEKGSAFGVRVTRRFGCNLAQL